LIFTTAVATNEFFSWDVRLSRAFGLGRGRALEAILDIFNLTSSDDFPDPAASSLLFNFDGTVRGGLGDPRQAQLGVRPPSGRRQRQAEPGPPIPGAAVYPLIHASRVGVIPALVHHFDAEAQRKTRLVSAALCDTKSGRRVGASHQLTC